MNSAIIKKERQLLESVGSMGSVLVALSGGVDSSLLLSLALRSGASVQSATVISDIITRDDLDFSRRVADELGVGHHIIDIDLLGVEKIRANGQDRCYHCKKEIFSRVIELARSSGIPHIIEGTNADDRAELRPGFAALRELGIRSPFFEAGIGKEDIRHLARESRLPVADRPPSPCLATRIAYNDTITVEKIKMIRHAEEWLAGKGITRCRARIHGNLARIEVEPGEYHFFVDPVFRKQLTDRFTGIGFTWVTLDLAGYREGSMMEEMTADAT